MQLRDLYHRGDPGVPAIYLVEYPSEKAFFNKFTTMTQYFTVKEKMDIIPPVKLFPWEQSVEEVFEDVWVICDEPYVVIDDEKHVVDDKAVSLHDITEIFRGWSQRLQLISIDKKTEDQARSFAKITLAEMERILGIYSDLNGIVFDFANKLKKEEDSSFKSKAKLFIVGLKSSSLKIYFKMIF